MTVVERFARWVEALGSQAAAAEELGCSQTMVSAIARGAKRPGIELIHRIEEKTTRWPAGQIRTEDWIQHEAPAAR